MWSNAQDRTSALLPSSLDISDEEDEALQMALLQSACEGLAGEPSVDSKEGALMRSGGTGAKAATGQADAADGGPSSVRLASDLSGDTLSGPRLRRRVAGEAASFSRFAPLSSSRAIRGGITLRGEAAGAAGPDGRAVDRSATLLRHRLSEFSPRPNSRARAGNHAPDRALEAERFHPFSQLSAEASEGRSVASMRVRHAAAHAAFASASNQHMRITPRYVLAPLHAVLQLFLQPAQVSRMPEIAEQCHKRFVFSLFDLKCRGSACQDVIQVRF